MSDVKALMPIQRMPDIWDDTKFWTSVSEVKGTLACWAIRQSPYKMPENLKEGCNQIAEYFANVKADKQGFFQTGCEELLKEVRKAIDVCPAIVAWNSPKKGDHHTVFISRYDQPHPDYDFIDLDALARNIAHSITVAKKYEQSQDKTADA